MNENKGTIEDAMPVGMPPKTHEQVAEAIRYQLDSYGVIPVGEEAYTKADTVAELVQGGFNDLAAQVKQMPEEEAAAIKMQVCVCEASQAPRVIHTGNGNAIDLSGTLKLFGAA